MEWNGTTNGARNLHSPNPAQMNWTNRLIFVVLDPVTRSAWPYTHARSDYTVIEMNSPTKTGYISSFSGRFRNNGKLHFELFSWNFARMLFILRPIFMRVENRPIARILPGSFPKQTLIRELLCTIFRWK